MPVGFFFVGHELEHGEEDLKNWWCRNMKVGQICGSSKNGAWVVVDVCISFFGGQLLGGAQEALQMCPQALLPYI